MDFKTGDKVKLRSYNSMVNEYGLCGESIDTKYFVVDRMFRFLGRVVTIQYVADDIFTIQEDGEAWNWDFEAIVPEEMR